MQDFVEEDSGEENSHEHSQQGNIDGETGEKDPLWMEVLKPKNSGKVEDLPSLPRKTSQDFSSFWELILQFGSDPAPVSGHKPLPLAAADLLPHIPSLKAQVYWRFLEEAEDAVRHRKPEFLPIEEELNFVRGRMVPQGLVDRAIRRRLPVLCEYDSLSTDSHLWQTIRAATALVASVSEDADSGLTRKLVGELVDAAVAIDAQLRDVQVVPAAALLTQSVSATALMRMPENLRNTYQMAKSILRYEFGLGIEQTEMNSGVIANLKFTSSDIWERMVAEYLEHRKVESETQASVKLFYSSPGKSGGPDKKPDFVISPTPDNPNKLVIDAKYKIPKKSISKASMSDQYQLATYSYRLDADAFLVYPEVLTDKFDEEEFLKHNRYLAPPGYQDGSDSDSERWHRIGVFTLPFPGEGERFNPAEPAAGKVLDKVLQPPTEPTAPNE